MNMQAAYEHNGRHVSREAFYAIACDPRRHVAVEACAGAGKTWMLVSRILRALLGEQGDDGAQAHEILAITFTKKAAGEMRQRLTEWLSAFACYDDDQLRAELRARGVEQARVDVLIAPLRGLHLRLLQQGRAVQIRTFHSWFAALLRNAPLAVLEELGLPAAYELLENDDEVKAQVWRPFHARLLREQDQGGTVLADYQAVVSRHGRSQTEKALEAVLDKRVEFALADAAGNVETSVPGFAEVFPMFRGLALPSQALLSEAVAARWRAWAQVLGQEKNKTPQTAAQAIEQAFTQQADADQRLAALRKAVFVAEADRLTQHLKKYPAAQQAEAELQPLLQAQQQHEAWVHQQRMIRLARILLEEYAALKRERGWVDMSDVERAALHLLERSELSAWLQQRLDARTRHLLIDEFQDTNPLQWQALHAWLSSYAGVGGGASGAGGAPRLFIVGDPKQSIYRFRRAEPQIFRAAQSFVQALGGDLLACDHTRRNAPAVLARVNAVLGEAQSQGEYEGFRAHTTESTQAGQAWVLPPIERQARDKKEAATVWRDSLLAPRLTPEDTLRARECRQAARWIAQRIEAGLPPKEVMVLARKRDRLVAMQAELLALGVPATQPEQADLGAAPEVQDLTALLDVLVSPGHDLSLARVLRSPLLGPHLGLDDTALLEIAARQRGGKQAWFDLLQTTPPAAWAHADLREVGPRLQRWQQWVRTLPPHDALDAIYADGDVVARYAAAAPPHLRARVQTHLQALLEAALQFDGGRYATPYALVRALRAGRLPAPAQPMPEGGAVRLLTVHGAKGLEAETVLILDTDTPPQRAQTMSVLLDWPGEASAPRSFVFLASEKEERLPPSAREAHARERAARGREELNMLYVALTRARAQLVFSAVQPHQQNTEGKSWWQRLLHECQPWEPTPPQSPADGVARFEGMGRVSDMDGREAGAPTQHEPAVAAPAASSAIVLRVLPDIRYQPVPVLAPSSEEDALAARIGSAMHRLLEWTALDTAEFSPAQLERAGAEQGLTPAQARQAADMARRIVHGAGAWVWRGADVAWWSNEVPVTIEGQARRIDRLVRHRDGTWWVLDYKSASYAQAAEVTRAQMLAQLRAYGDAVRAACAGEPVRIALLDAQGHWETLA
ncbi:UvrD-helicase domain-containing protein [Hylemonella gracilis]|uniref:DNA 3'-5' helicase n=1 Tax=Hylemonella gracilis ATCC 19624 TaxID=887062 RepID=F3KV87_9BURK|nr:UvrD-helicase domain-containing protein [Hylemonella gracilis]EGI76310.1 uvrd/rep helicase [Hylemonella gracilis ATCC 19624]